MKTYSRNVRTHNSDTLVITIRKDISNNENEKLIVDHNIIAKQYVKKQSLKMEDPKF